MLNERFKKAATWLAVGLYAALVVALQVFHEPWFDEVQAWLIARDASLWDMTWLAGYEGSPMLWHVLLKPLTLFGMPFVVARVAYTALAIVTVGVFARWAPLPWWGKFLVPFGWIFAYEYGVIMRSYLLVALLLFIAASQYKKRVSHPWRYVVPLLLLAHTNLFGLWLTISVGAFYAIEIVRDRKVSPRHALALGLLVASAATALLLVWPPDDVSLRTLGGFNDSLYEGRFEQLGYVGAAVFAHIARPGGSYWNTLLWTPVVGYVGFGLMLLSFLVIIIRDRFIALLYLVSSAGLLLLYGMLSLYLDRYLAIFYLIFLFALWVSMPTDRLSTIKRRFVHWGVLALLLLQLPHTVSAGWGEVTQVFSGPRPVAEVLQERGATEDTLLIVEPFFGSALLPFLAETHRTVYSLHADRDISYVVWNRLDPTVREISFVESRERVNRVIAEREPKEAYLIVSDKTEELESYLAEYDEVVSYTDVMTKWEHYIVLAVPVE